MSSKITTIVANFKTQIATTINVGSTTGAIKGPAVDSDGVQLANGRYVMNVNLGEANEEHLIFDLVGSTGAMSNIVSISRQGVETVGALQQHRVGAKVVLTNYANLLYISKILMGQTALDGANPLFYDLAPTFSNALQLATKGYVDSAIAGGVGTATDATGGTNFMTKNQNAKPRARSAWVREQDTPDKTLKVESFRLTFTDKIVAYGGGNTPNFIDPGLAGDMAFNTNPTNGETMVITVDGVPTTVTFVTSIGSTAGNILIGGTVATTRANFVNFINNPGTTNANQVAVTGTNLTAIQKLSATDDLTLNAFVRVINTASTSFSVVENLAGAGNTWTANTTKNRYDLVVVDNAGTLQIRKGVEAVSPVVPTPTTGDIVICLVLNRTGQTTVRGNNIAGQAYITDYYDLSVYRTDLITTATLPSFSPGAVYGNGVDGAIVLDGTNTYPSLFSKSGSTYTTLKDVMATTLSVSSGVIVEGNGYKLQATVSITNAGTIRNNGFNGTNGQNFTANGVTGGLGAPAGSLPGGTNGADSTTGNPSGAGTSKTKCLVGNAGKGGTGQTGVGAGSAGGNGGTSTAPLGRVPLLFWMLLFADVDLTRYSVNPGAGAGGCSGVNGGNQGGGGSAGGGGGVVWLSAPTITNSGTIQANGGVGGNGGSNSGGGTGGAGAGGCGGVVVLACSTYNNTGTVQAIKGNSGTGGNGDQTASSDGVVYQITV